MDPRPIRHLAALAVLAAAAPGLAADDAACNLYPQAALSYAKGEDSDFFTSQGGVPNVVFLLDSSGSINRMAPDGAVNTWGSFGGTYGCANAYADALRYHSPCSLTGEENRSYSDTVNYGEIAKVCPYLDGAATVKTGLPGFDPDYFCAGGGTACNGHANFFDRYHVFHDNDLSSGAFTSATCDAVGPGATASGCRGFDSTAVTPAATSVASYCDAWKAPYAITDEAARRASCNACLTTKGYWYSGVHYRNDVMPADPANGDGASAMACGDTKWCSDHALGVCVARSDETLEYGGGDRKKGVCRLPHLYFTGNFLSFQPPKFVALRKVMKDVLMDARRIRMGLVTFDADQGGALAKGLNPSCNLVYPPSPSSFESNRGSFLTAVKAVTFATSTDETPLAEALFNVGQMYRSPSLPWFGGTYERSDFGSHTGNRSEICFACQKSSVIVITDGLSSGDDAIPGLDFAAQPMTAGVAKASGSYAGMAGYNIKGIDAATCPLCDTDAERPEPGLPSCTGVNPTQGACNAGLPTFNYLPKVAWYLHHMDFRKNEEGGSDCGKMSGRQGIDVYTIGYGVRGSAEQVLAHAAYRDDANPTDSVGGGLSRSASDVGSLKQAILDVYDDVSTRSTSFGGASVGTIQTSATIGTLVPRFNPNKSAAWEGRLYQFQIFSEFSAGCKATAAGQPFDPDDKDCDRDCRSIFLIDGDGDFIQENDIGLFVKNSPRNLPACGSTNKCGSCASVGTTPAVPVWEASEKLAQVQWANRSAWTVVDSNADGKLDAQDALLRLQDDDATAQKLLPYVQAGGTTCKVIADQLALAGNGTEAGKIRAGYDEILAAKAAGTTPSDSSYAPCVRAMIKYLLGADLKDADGDGDYTDDRPDKLGDIFHSSPAVVYPPFSQENAERTDVIPPQYLPTLLDRQETPDEYAKYVETHRSRERFVMAGANDGFLHAFRASAWRPGDDTRTLLVQENGWHDERVGGDEIWAFFPPDLLSKLPLLLGSVHHFWVDSESMIRDVWVDDNHDDQKQAAEYRTLLVQGERRGGNRYFALDVTRASGDLDSKPVFRWIWPPPGAPQTLSVAESWAEFLPKPPPIGPVRIDARTDAYGVGTNTPKMLASTGETVPYHERWIAFLSGGFDASLARGHGVYMVDAWTGDLVWEFSQRSASPLDPADPQRELRFPIAATVAMVPHGKENAQLAGVANADLRFFDTASVGDLGGQLWILRFYDPARLGGPKRTAQNWAGARLLQGGRVGCSTAAFGQPFFAITTSTVLTSDGSFRLLVGTGDRYNLLDTDGGTCGPDNLRACLLKGCTVKVDSTYALPESIGTSVASASATAAACFPMSAAEAGASGTCQTSNARVTVQITNCPNPEVPLDTSTRFDLGASCVPDGPSWACTAVPSTMDEGVKLRLLDPISLGNRFYSLKVFSSARPIFNDLTGAKRYDLARLTDTSPTLVQIDASSLSPTPATPLHDGWVRYFTNGADVTVDGTAFARIPVDERVVGGASLAGSRVFFNTLQPLKAKDTSGAGGCSASPCKPNRAQGSYLYGAVISSGAPALTDDSGFNLIPPVFRPTPVPPKPPVDHIFVNPEGKVMRGLVSVPVGGPPTNLSVSGIEDPNLDFGWIDVDAVLHACRHEGNAAACR
jgi:type IV pilus assembly protein PilY1